MGQDRKDAEEVKNVVEVEEKNAKEAQMEATKIKTTVESEVSESNAALEKILEEMKGLTSKDVSVIYGFSNPVPKVKHLMIGLCFLLLDKKDIAYKQSLGDEEVDTFFFIQARKHLLKDAKDLMDKIMNFNKDNIDSFRIKKIKELITTHPKRRETWTTQQMSSVCNQVLLMFSFINCMIVYNDMMVRSGPLREKYQEVQEILRIKKEELAIKVAQLNKINKKLEKL